MNRFMHTQAVFANGYTIGEPTHTCSTHLYLPGNPSAVWKAGRTTDQEQILESDGSYLNGLVQATAESIGNEVRNMTQVMIVPCRR